MKLPSIKCNTPLSGGNASAQAQCATQASNTFFALSKGDNAGRPMRQPCTNCFIVQCDNANETDYYYHLSWGLWQSRQFHPLLKGSVIPFLTITDYRHTLIDAARITGTHLPQFNQAITTMQQLENLEELTRAKLETLKQLRVAIFQKLLHS